MSDLDRRVIVITGASSGLGIQFARAVAAAGGRPILAARRVEKLAEVQASIPGADVIACDVTVEADRSRLVDATLERHGRIDGLVNNAGTSKMTPALRGDLDDFVRILDTNLTAPFALSCLAATAMRRTGGGSIVNVASVMASRSVDQLPDAAYVASKAGLVGLTRELASQWGRHAIRVNALAPGFFASEMTRGLGARAAEFPDYLTGAAALGRVGHPGELDAALVFLLSTGSSFVTGDTLTVDGGMATR